MVTEREAWGSACAALDGDADFCDQRYNICLHLEAQDV
jgi:hypothetical protein